MMKRIIGNVSLLMLLTAAAVFSSPLTGGGSQGSLSYSTVFENLGGGILRITVTNTSVVAPVDESGVIGAVFFSLSGDPVLTPVSVSLGSGSSVVNGSGDPSLNWMYLAGLSGPGGATQGLSAAGYGLFGSSGNFCSGVKCGNLLQGIDWGLVDSVYIAGTGNSSIRDQPLIQDTAVFLLSGLPPDFDPSIGVTTVSAQYTATLDGLNIPDPAGVASPAGVPEPASCLLMGGGLILFSMLQRRKNRQ